MAEHSVTVLPADIQIEVPTGALASEAIQQAGLDLQQPCGGQGRCGRCAVVIESGKVRRRSTIRLSQEAVDAGFALACQSIIEGDAVLRIPEQERISRRLITDKTARKVEIPAGYDPQRELPLRIVQVDLPEPTMEDNLDDWTRLRRALDKLGYAEVSLSLLQLRSLGKTLRESQWSPWVLLDLDPEFPDRGRILEVATERPRPYGLALDIGTTTVTAYLVDMTSGEVKGSAAEYNDQIRRGEDVISRIIYAGKGEGLTELGQLVRETLDTLLERLRLRTGVEPAQIHRMTVSGNTTMMHLFLGLPPESIRRSPFIPAVNVFPVLSARDLDLPLHPEAPVECLPGVASYVGADITAGVLSSGMAGAEQLTLFIDVGTNGETVLGTEEWMITCACSAGPAFEGAGVVDGMRATEGAIEEVWVHSSTYEPTLRVIGGGKSRGLCGSGLISLLAELFFTGVIDRAGNVKLDMDTPRVREGDHGPEYVIAWSEETETGKDIVLTKVDVDNLLRAKAAIYAGFSVLAASVGIDLADVEQVLIGGSFGKYINVENAIKIGLLPDLAWDRFHFLGNTSVLGAYYGLISRERRNQIHEIAGKMTYVELSADNSFYDAFTAALFLPHTEIDRFPAVAEVWARENGVKEPQARREPETRG